MDNSEKILSKIKKEEIKPIPKWHFNLRSYFVLSSYLLFILIGAISFSVILFSIQQSDFELLLHFNHSGLEFFLVFLPLLWLLSMTIFIAIAIISARNTQKGYKLTFGKWIAYSAALSITIGTLFFISGGAKWFEKSFANQVEIYESMEERKIHLWSQPETGTLSGSILSYTNDTIFLIDFKEQHWKILSNNAVFSPMALIESGEMIKVNGTMRNKSTFDADKIRPWGGYGKNSKNNHKSERKNNR